MKKNDKLIVIFGVVILVLASVGIYYWAPTETKKAEANLEDVFSISGVLSSNTPDAISVSNSSPFYALIATPLAVHYDVEGMQHIVPLYVKNTDNPSSAVIRVESQIGIQSNEIQIPEMSDISVKDSSLNIAKKYWKHSDGVLLIENNETGYDLGVVAIPLASYLSMPVIITDKIDQDVKEVLQDLGVKYSLVCGNIDGYGDYIKFDNVDEIVDASIKLVQEKFGDINYITLTNPRDAYPPKVLNSTSYSFESKKAGVANLLPSTILNLGKKGDSFSFTIPKDYKYARVVMEIINQEPGKNIEEFGDCFMLADNLTRFILSVASPPILDSSGEKIKNDRLYYEDTFYNKGGTEFTIAPFAYVLTNIIPEYTATVRIEKLDNPYQPLMKQLSSLAPYLTAYHKGIIFAKPEFAFANDDNIKLNGKNLPGTTTPKGNYLMIPLLNQHVYEKIHEPLNELLAKITDINISTSTESLKKYCYDNPFYIALVGDATMLPEYFYRNPHSEPFTDPSTLAPSDIQYIYGTNTPSDFIYGNIDPESYSLKSYPADYLENDLYSKYPEMENIVGRILGGFDVQDTSALLARTVFYNDVLSTQPEEWKNNALVMSGAGLEFQALPLINAFYTAMGSKEPMKFPSGQQHFLSLRTQNYMTESGGFNTEKLERGQAQRVGFSKEALTEIKQSNILSILLFPKEKIQLVQGLENINSLFSLKWWSIAREDQSGIHGGTSQENSNLIQGNAHGIFYSYNMGDVMMYSRGGPLWQLLIRVLEPALGIPLRSSLEMHGDYGIRDVSLMKMGPSVMFVECCGGGKIDSLSPLNTLSAAYQHAGVNAFICPTQLSAISGYLEPRNKEVGFGLTGYFNASKNAKNGEYPEPEFCGWIFEHSYEEMFKHDATIGEALRNARNGFLPSQFDVKYLWTPPLNIDKTGGAEPIYIKSTASSGDPVHVEKYSTVYELNLLGDPAFNPYQPCNEGNK